MLRRHLKSGGAPVAACAGFDFDAASAYLEDALGESHRAGYESHLAGCVTCRRHLIELARLAETAPRAETQPSIVEDQIPAGAPAWVRWRGVAAGWFDLSSWKLKWQVAGAAGATFAILIAALGVVSWRHSSEPSSIAINLKTGAQPSMESTVPSPTPEPSPQDVSPIDEAESAAGRPAQTRVPVPTPLVTPNVGDVSLPITPSNESSKLSSNLQNGPLLFDSNRFYPTQQMTTDARQSNAPLQGRFSQQNAQQVPDGAGNASKPGLGNLGGFGRADAPDSDRRSRRNDLGSRFTLPGINTVNTEPVELKPRPPEDQENRVASKESNAKTPEPGSPGKAQPDKSSSRLNKTVAEIIRAINPLPTKTDPKDARTLVAGNKPESKPESAEKPKPAEDESAKPMKRHIRDKVFVFRRDINMWIDQDFKEATMTFRQYRLIRGSKEYEEVLAREPQLKEFFEFGPITIVWKNKIYRVIDKKPGR